MLGALLGHALVKDGALLPRAGGVGWVAYVVPARGVDPGTFSDELQACLPPSVQCVPVTRIPVGSEGEIDEAALRALPVVTPDALQRWRQAVLASPNVARADVTLAEHRESSDTFGADAKTLLFAARQRRVPAIPSRGPGRPGKMAFAEGPEIEPGRVPRNLQTILSRAAQRADGEAIRYVSDRGVESHSYADLLASARRVTAGLYRRGLKPGDRAVIQSDSHREFLTAFWGCILGGVVPVPAPVAPAYDGAHANAAKLLKAWEVLRGPRILASDRLTDPIAAFVPRLRAGHDVLSIPSLAAYPSAGDLHDSAPGDTAVMMLTSGSTGTPKCVMLTHANLLARSVGSVQMNQFSPDEVTLNWMPFDHVAGLLYFHLRDVFLGCRQVHAPIGLVLADPLRWFDWVNEFRVSITFAPNFAYGLVNGRAKDIPSKPWDLSCLRHLLNGAEAIVPRTARRCLALLMEVGLPPNAMRPAWGMSETSSGVTYSSRFSLQSTSDTDALAEVGDPIPGLAMRIVNDRDEVVEEGVKGKLEVRGPCVAPGYFENPTANAQAFTADGWFRTGDVGLISEGRLTVSGRDKDDIVINGVNYLSHEIEAVVDGLEGVEASYTAACAVRPHGSDTDQMAIFFAQATAAPLDLAGRIRRAVLQHIGAVPQFVVPLARANVPKTSVGKIQRSQLARAFERGELSAGATPDGRQSALPQWFFKRRWWRRKAARRAAGTRTYLVFLDGDGLGEAVCARLEASGNACIKVGCAGRYESSEGERYAIDPANAEHYMRLGQALRDRRITAHALVWLRSYGDAAESCSSGAAEMCAELSVGFLHLVQAMRALVPGETQLSLFVVASGMHKARDRDTVECAKTALAGLASTAAEEMPELELRLIDLPPPAAASPHTQCAAIAAELLAVSPHSRVAYRDGERWVCGLERCLPDSFDAASLPIEQDSFYVVSGGLGGIGSLLAELLLESYGAKLLLFGKTALDAADGSARRARLEKLEACAVRFGGAVRYSAMDVGDAPALQAAVREAGNAFGKPLAGVFHLAGAFHEALLGTESSERLAGVLASRARAAESLHALLEQRPDAFFVSFASVNGIFGGRGVGAYSAANGLLEGFVHGQRARGANRSYCLFWSLWRGVGMSAGHGLEELSIRKGYRPISGELGMQSLLLALCQETPDLIIGLDENNVHVRWQLQAPLQLLQAPVLHVATTDGQPPSMEALPQLLDDQGRNVGYILRQSNVDEAAGNDQRAVDPALHATLASMWQAVLKIDRIGVNDNFFDLGGDSVRLAQLAGKLSDAAGRSVSMLEIFDHPTIAAQARLLAPQMPAISVLPGRDRGQKRRHLRAERRGH